MRGIYKPQALAHHRFAIIHPGTVIDILGFDQSFAVLSESLFRKRDDYAFVTEDGNIIDLFTPRTYLKHSLKNRLETGALRQPASTSAEAG